MPIGFVLIKDTCNPVKIILILDFSEMKRTELKAGSFSCCKLAQTANGLSKQPNQTPQLPSCSLSLFLIPVDHFEWKRKSKTLHVTFSFLVFT